MIRCVGSLFRLSISGKTLGVRSFRGAPAKENAIRQKWTEALADQARALIFGEKKYAQMNRKERALVDRYQQVKLREDGVILPNTRMALEQEEIERRMFKGVEPLGKGD